MVCLTRLFSAAGALADVVRPRRAFTLTELLIVLAILAMIAAFIVPLVTGAVGATRKALCQNQLHQIGLALLSEAAEGRNLQQLTGLSVPDYTRWEGTVVDADLYKLTVCPSDMEPPIDPFEGIKDLYFHQTSIESHHWGEFHTSLYSMLNGEEPPDKQMCYMFRGNAFVGSYYGDPNNYSWDEYLNAVGGSLDDNQLLMTAGSGAILLTFSSTYVTIEEFDPRPEWTAEYGHLIGSNHYLCKGSGEDWESEIIRTFIGRNNLIAAKSLVNLAKVSYGMNSLVQNLNPSLNQIYMVEYTDHDIVLHLNPADEPFDGDLANGEVMYRHTGKANVLFVNGSVETMGPLQLEPEFAGSDGQFYP